MKKLYLFLIFGLVCFTYSCSENVGIESDDNQITTRAKPTKVTICHYNNANGKYKTKTINEKHLAKHLAHGDYEGACEDVVVCDPVCIFCDYIDLMDFDEPCPENPFNYGDNLCTQYTPDPDCPADPNFGSWEYSLWDRDKNRNDFCGGTDDENDAGTVSVFWEKHCDGSFFGQVRVIYDELGDGIYEIEFEDFGATEADYNKALYCKSKLESIATELGLLDACEVEEPTCDPVCIFCDYIYLMDFDEPCLDNPFDGDVYCSTFVSAGCLENPEAGTGQTYLWDRDFYRNLSPFCGSDDENDSGAIQVDWEIGCDGSLFGQVSVFYDANGDGVFEVEELDLGATEENYNRALYCKTILESIATELGLTDACPD